MSPEINNRKRTLFNGRNLLVSLLVGYLLLSLTACDENCYYHRAVILPVKGWELDHSIRFSDTLPASSPARLHATLTLRHNNLYPYQNIWLFVQAYSSDSLLWADSLNYTLAKPDGRWLGRGWGSIYSIDLPLPDLSFPDSSRQFTLVLQHGLKDSQLIGIEDISLKLNQ